ncbi:MAG: MgtC/SapB family protein, partial [Rubrivivax sp.]|nr:MgtC/SapB family protein [Rubrivivax sp.]
MIDTGTALGLAAALGGGLLIGLERERRKRGRDGKGPHEAAGIRSFALAALGGGIAQTLQQPLLVAMGALMVAALVAVAYWKSREQVPGEPPPDPGLTTELALFITYLVGVLSVQQPALGAGAAAVVAGLLAARDRLHHLATQVLSDAELHDALLLA